MCENTCEARGFHRSTHTQHVLFNTTPDTFVRSRALDDSRLETLFSLVSGAGVRTHTRADHVHDLTHRDGNWDSREKNLLLQTDIYSSYTTL